MDIRKQIREVEQLELKKLVVKKFGRSFEVYPWIKSRIFHKVMMGKEVLQEKNTSVFWQQVRSLPYGFFSLFRKYDAWAFSHNGERIELDGTYVDKVMDPLTQGTDLKVLMIELQLAARIKRRDVASRNIISRAIFVFVEELYAKLFLRKFTLEGSEILQEVEQILDTTVEVEAIVKKYLAQYRVMRFFLWLLPKPKVVFHTVSYANFGYIRAWKEAGIKVVEIQHGLIGDGHYGYVYHQRLNDNQFPDEILVFGNADAAFFDAQTVIPIEKAIPVGRFVMDHFKRKAIPNRIPATTILVSLQDSDWSIALIHFVFECDRLTDKRINWIIQPRRTPAVEYQKLFDFPENIVFSQRSIYDAIGAADAHLTIFSTTAIESLSIGKPTFLFDYEGAAHTYLGGFLDSNPNAYFCADEHEFLNQWKDLRLVSLEEISASNDRNISSDYQNKIANYVFTLLNEVSAK